MLYKISDYKCVCTTAIEVCTYIDVRGVVHFERPYKGEDVVQKQNRGREGREKFVMIWVCCRVKNSCFSNSLIFSHNSPLCMSMHYVMVIELVFSEAVLQPSHAFLMAKMYPAML